MTNEDTPPNPPAKPTPRLVYPGNGGAPIIPGNPGNSGGKKGRSGGGSVVIRLACRESFAKRRRTLERIADGKVEGATVADRVRAIDLLGKYGLDSRTQQIDILEVRERVKQTLEVIGEMLEPQLALDVVARLRPIWGLPG